MATLTHRFSAFADRPTKGLKMTQTTNQTTPVKMPLKGEGFCVIDYESGVYVSRGVLTKEQADALIVEDGQTGNIEAVDYHTSLEADLVLAVDIQNERPGGGSWKIDTSSFFPKVTCTRSANEPVDLEDALSVLLAGTSLFACHTTIIGDTITAHIRLP